MRALPQAQNPFMLMLDPEVVLAAVRGSEKLEKLARRVCHPLDRPAPVAPADGDGPKRKTPWADQAN